MAGHLNFYFMNMAASMAPISLAMVVMQTAPFWISIIARVWLKEPIIYLELIGMFICFSMVGLIAYEASEDDEKALEEEEEGNKSQEFLGIMIVVIASFT